MEAYCMTFHKALSGNFTLIKLFIKLMWCDLMSRTPQPKVVAGACPSCCRSGTDLSAVDGVFWGWNLLRRWDLICTLSWRDVTQRAQMVGRSATFSCSRTWLYCLTSSAQGSCNSLSSIPMANSPFTLPQFVPNLQCNSDSFSCNKVCVGVIC